MYLLYGLLIYGLLNLKDQSTRGHYLLLKPSDEKEAKKRMKLKMSNAQDSVDSTDGKEKKSFDWNFVKGFAAGIIISNINKIFVLGTLVGTISGIYIEQNYDRIPHVKTEIHKVLKIVKDSYGNSRKSRKDNDE